MISDMLADPTSGLSYWAYAVKDSVAVLVRCSNPDHALFERERLKASDAKTVGSITKRRVSEQSIRSAMALRNWSVGTVR